MNKPRNLTVALISNPMKRVTIKDIAEYLCVSISTVSRALSNDKNIRKETRDKIFEAADMLGYRRNNFAASLRNGHTNTIGVIAGEMISPVVSCALKGIQQVMHAEGINVLVCNSDGDPALERANIAMMEHALVDGIIIFPCPAGNNTEAFKNLEKSGIPLVFVAADPSGVDASSIVTNHYNKAYFLIDHLICSGRRHIAHLAGPEHITQNIEIMQAYKDALDKFRIPFAPELVVSADVSVDGGAAAIDMLIDKGIFFDAVFACNDLLAIGAMNRLREHGRNVPADVGVAGFSGSPLSSLVYPPLTTVELPLPEMGIQAAKHLLSKIRYPELANKKIIVDSSIKLRASTHF